MRKSPSNRLSLVKIGNSVLRAKTNPLSQSQLKDKKFQAFLLQMVKTMRHAQGVGLAANQVGLDCRALVMECRGNRRYPRVGSFPLQTYLNAKIVHYSTAVEKDWE